MSGEGEGMCPGRVCCYRFGVATTGSSDAAVPGVLSSSPMDSEARVLIDFMDSVFYGPGWHGPELYPTLQSLSVEQALEPGGPDGYSSWQIVLHCAYWKHVILRRLGNADLGQLATDEKFSKESLVLSIAAHDAYHTGHLRNMGVDGLK